MRDAGFERRMALLQQTETALRNQMAEKSPPPFSAEPPVWVTVATVVVTSILIWTFGYLVGSVR